MFSAVSEHTFLFINFSVNASKKAEDVQSHSYQYIAFTRNGLCSQWHQMWSNLMASVVLWHHPIYYRKKAQRRNPSSPFCRGARQQPYLQSPGVPTACHTCQECQMFGLLGQSNRGWPRGHLGTVGTGVAVISGGTISLGHLGEGNGGTLSCPWAGVWTPLY